MNIFYQPSFLDSITESTQQLFNVDIIIRVVESNADPYELSTSEEYVINFSAQCKTLWDFGFRTYDARLKSMIFRNRYSSSAMP